MVEVLAQVFHSHRRGARGGPLHAQIRHQLVVSDDHSLQPLGVVGGRISVVRHLGALIIELGAGVAPQTKEKHRQEHRGDEHGVA